MVINGFQGLKFSLITGFSEDFFVIAFPSKEYSGNGLKVAMICLSRKFFSSKISSQLTIYYVSMTLHEYGRVYMNYTVGNKYYSGIQSVRDMWHVWMRREKHRGIW